MLQAIELLKAVQHTYFRKSALIAGQMLHIHRFLQALTLLALLVQKYKYCADSGADAPHPPLPSGTLLALLVQKYKY